MNTNTTNTTQPPQRIDIQKEAVCLSIKMGMLHTRRRIRTSQIVTDADPAMVHVAKDIFESEELQAISRHHGLIRTWLKMRCLPSPFRSGVYLIRLSLVSEVMDALNGFEQAEKQLIETFLKFYDTIYNQRNNETSDLSSKLGTLYNAEDYPNPRAVAQAFTFETQLWEIGTPGALRSVDRALYEREAAKMQNVWESARVSITQVLLTEFRDMTARMAERMVVGPDGKAKVFRETLVGNLQDWLDVFDKRAITDDATLLGQVQKARALIAGIDGKTLRDSESLKVEVAEGMQQITSTLDAAIIERPGRLIQMED